MVRSIFTLLIAAAVSTPTQAATIVFSGADGTAGTNEIQFFRSPAHPGLGASSIGDITDLTTDFGVGPFTLQAAQGDPDPGRLVWSSGMIGTIDESDPNTTYVGFDGGTALSISGALYAGLNLIAEGVLFSGAFPLLPDVLTFALNEPCLYPAICTGTISGPILAGGLLDPAVAAALGVKPAVLGGFFSLSANNLVYDDATGEVEGVVTTKFIELQVEQVPAPPVTLLLLIGIAVVGVRRLRG